MLILPGSGPTDRDGNNPMGITAAPYRMLAEALATKGVSSVRIDKRGLFGSKAAIPDPKLGPRHVDVATMYNTERYRPQYDGKEGLPVFLIRA